MKLRLRDHAVAVAAHAALLLAPPAGLAGLRAISRPESLACVALMIALATSESAAARTSDASRWGAPGTRLAAISAGGLLVTAWLAIGTRGGAPLWAWLGALLGVAGILLRARAMRDLGAAFTSETVRGPTVFRGGIYRVLAHPSELGLALVAAALAILGGSPPAGATALLVVLPSAWLRMRAEDLTLASHCAGPQASARVDP